MADNTLFPGTSMPDAVWWARLWPQPEKVLEQLGIKPGMTVVDLCCGNGYFTIPLAHLTGGGGAVYGIDLDKTLLKEAEKAAACNNVAIQWVYGDARHMEELLPEKADCVLVANTFHGVPEKRLLAHGVANALREQGRFIVINWHAIPREQTRVLNEPRGPGTEARMSPAQLRSIVEQAGFTQREIVDLPPYHYGSVFQKNSES